MGFNLVNINGRNVISVLYYILDIINCAIENYYHISTYIMCLSTKALKANKVCSAVKPLHLRILPMYAYIHQSFSLHWKLHSLNINLNISEINYYHLF